MIEPDRPGDLARCFDVLDRNLFVQVGKRVEQRIVEILFRHPRHVVLGQPEVFHLPRCHQRDPGDHVELDVLLEDRVENGGEHRLRVGRLRSALQAHHQHGFEHAGLDQTRPGDTGRTAGRAAGVHPHDRLSGAAEGFHAPAIRLVNALENFGRGGKDDGVDFAEIGIGIAERGTDRLEHQFRAADIGPRRAKLGLAEAENSRWARSHVFSSTTALAYSRPRPAPETISVKPSTRSLRAFASATSPAA